MMKAKLIAATLLALGTSGHAVAQDPTANLQSALNNLVPNLTATTDAALSMNVTSSTRGLNQTVGDLHQDVSAGTPLETNNALGNSLVILATPHTRLIDNILAGEQSPATAIQEVNVQALTAIGTNLLFAFGPNLLANSDGTVLDPQVFLAVFDSSLSPINNIKITTLLGAGNGAGTDLPLDLAMVTGLLGEGTGGLPAIPTAPAGLSLLTALLGGSNSEALPTSTVLNVLALGDTGTGLPVDDLPLSPDALDPSALTALLSGTTLPGL